MKGVLNQENIQFTADAGTQKCHCKGTINFIAEGFWQDDLVYALYGEVSIQGGYDVLREIGL